MVYRLEKLVDGKWLCDGEYPPEYIGNLFGACFSLGQRGVTKIRIVIDEDEEEKIDK